MSSVLLQSKLGSGTGERGPTQRQRGTWGLRKGKSEGRWEEVVGLGD